MSYTRKVCSKCDHDAGEGYHNVDKCPACGQHALVSVTPWDHQSPCVCKRENTSLRAEVNALRAKLGMDRKYVEWNVTLKQDAPGTEPAA